MAKKFYKEDGETIPSVVYVETPPAGFTEIVDQDELTRLYLQLNKRMKEDGLDYVSKFKVDNFGIKYRDGTLTEANVDYLYNKLVQLILRLEDGNWASALHHLNNTLNTPTQTDIDNGYTQEVHDNIVADITNYLNA